jgi:hypothetical protein
MRLLLVSIAFLIGQMNTLQEKPVVYLQPHSDAIQTVYGGKLLELINTPATIHLPSKAPKVDADGDQWTIQIKNLGPNGVTVVDAGHFRVQINVGQTIHVYSNGAAYSVK